MPDITNYHDEHKQLEYCNTN